MANGRVLQAANLLRGKVKPNLSDEVARDTGFLKEVLTELQLPTTTENVMQIATLLSVMQIPTFQEYPKAIPHPDDPTKQLVVADADEESQVLATGLQYKPAAPQSPELKAALADAVRREKTAADQGKPVELDKISPELQAALDEAVKREEAAKKSWPKPVFPAPDHSQAVDRVLNAPAPRNGE